MGEKKVERPKGFGTTMPFNELIDRLGAVTEIMINVGKLGNLHIEGEPVLGPLTLGAISGGVQNLIRKLQGDIEEVKIQHALHERSVEEERDIVMAELEREEVRTADLRKVLSTIMRIVGDGKVTAERVAEIEGLGDTYRQYVADARGAFASHVQRKERLRAAESALGAMYEAVVTGEPQTDYTGFEERVETAIELFRQFQKHERLIKLIEAESRKHKKNRRGIAELRQVLASGGDA